MQITGLRARNFLSWKTLDVDNLQSLEIWVGPNGAGKSNLGSIIKVVNQAVEALHTNGALPLADDYRFVPHSDGPVEAAIRCSWTADEETSVLTTMLGAALANPTEIARILELPNNLPIDRKRWNTYLEALASRFLTAEVASGWLAIRWYDGPRSDALLYYEFQTERDKKAFLILGPAMDGYLTRELPEVSPSSWGGADASRVYHQQLEGPVQEAVKAYLSGASDILPELPPCSVDRLLEGVAPQTVRLEVEPTLPGNNEFTGPFTRAAQMTGVPLDSSHRVLGGHAFKTLMRSKLIILDNWRTPPHDSYTLPELASRQLILSDGQDLALYLFRLKTGDQAQRQQYRAIQQRFAYIFPDQSLEVELGFSGSGSSKDASTKASLRLVVESADRTISLLRSGAGTIELAILTIVLSTPKDYVVFMDEPGTNLHPRTQRALLRYVRSMVAQRFLITHSPYLIAPDLFSHVRRVFMEVGKSHLFSYRESATDSGSKSQEDMEQNLSDPKLEQMLRRDTDIVSMVFASCVLLVEGETELGALPVWFEQVYGVGLDEFNVLVYAVGGKDNFGKVLRYLHFLHVPWILLCDGDALDPAKGRGGRTLFSQLAEIGIDGAAVQDRPFQEQVRWLNEIGVFASGATLQGKFETVPEIAEALTQAPEGTKPQQGRWVAETTPCPAYLLPVFNMVSKRASIRRRGRRHVRHVERRRAVSLPSRGSVEQDWTERPDDGLKQKD